MLFYYNNSNLDSYLITISIILRTIDLCGNSKLRIMYIIIDEIHKVSKNYRVSSTGSKKYTLKGTNDEENDETEKHEKH